MSELLNREFLGTPVSTWLLALAVALAFTGLLVLARWVKARGEKDPAALKAERRGALRVVALEDLEIIDWSLTECLRLHISCGSHSPGHLHRP